MPLVTSSDGARWETLARCVFIIAATPASNRVSDLFCCSDRQKNIEKAVVQSAQGTTAKGIIVMPNDHIQSPSSSSNT